MDGGEGEDAASSRGPQRGQRLGRPQGRVRLRGLWGRAAPLEPVCGLGLRAAPGSGLFFGAPAGFAAALHRIPLPLQGEFISLLSCGLNILVQSDFLTVQEAFTPGAAAFPEQTHSSNEN